MTRTGTRSDTPDPGPDDPVEDADAALEGHVVTTAQRLRGVESWLLLAETDTEKARREWRTTGLAFLKCGLLFSAVRIPGHVVHAAAGGREPDLVDAYLAEALDGGPVFASAGLTRYYALVGGGAVHDWKTPGVECLASGTRLGVPEVSRIAYKAGVPYWSVPVGTPGDVCSEDLLQAMIVRGWTALEEAARRASERGRIS